MLKKINRGLGRKDFENSRRIGKLIQSPLFGVSIVNNNHLTENVATKVGFIISKKISKKAVERNKIRRRMSEAMKKMLFGDNKLAFNYKIIVLVRKNILEAKLEDILECWKIILKRDFGEKINLK